jgi:hypothetical protein
MSEVRALPQAPLPEFPALKHEKRGPEAALSLDFCFYIHYIKLE